MYKLSSLALVVVALLSSTAASAFSSPAFLGRPQSSRRSSRTTTTTTTLDMGGNNEGLDLSGNTWKPDSGKMGSTDVGDYFPDGYDGSEVDFTSGMMGSQSGLNKDHSGPQLPGMENFAEGAFTTGGLEAITDIPADMEFVASSRPDGEYNLEVAASSSGKTMNIDVKPVCMTYEDFYARFTDSSHPAFSVTPNTGRMDRRGGEPTVMAVKIEPNGATGDLKADLVINLPEDNSKICYKFSAKSY